VVAETFPSGAGGSGALFGTALWAAADEIAVPALGLSTPPIEHPPSTHAYALASHVVYGLTAETIRRMVRSAI
jgi:uncharacterized membrane protein YagU involved in acid resistance